MLWMKPEESEKLAKIARMAERLDIYRAREYDNRALLGAAPVFMENDRRVVVYDLRAIKELAEELLEAFGG